MDENQFDEWQTWLVNVLMPLNTFCERLVLENAYLIREDEMPECLMELVTHVSAYKSILDNWEAGNIIKSSPLITYPDSICDYAMSSFLELKDEQKRLIGKS